MNSKGYTYKVVKTSYGTFHVRRRESANDMFEVVGSYKYRFIAEQVANFLSQADDRDEYVDVVMSKEA